MNDYSISNGNDNDNNDNNNNDHIANTTTTTTTTSTTSTTNDNDKNNDIPMFNSIDNDTHSSHRHSPPERSRISTFGERSGMMSASSIGCSCRG